MDDKSIIAGLKKFQGVGRRFQMLGEKHFQNGSAIIVDDYGHHPQEILSTIDAFRRVWPQKRLVHVFQPHRYTRTQSLHNDFVNVLSLADELLLLDIYPAGESAIPGISSENLANKIRDNNKRVTIVNEQSLKTTLNEYIKDGDVILMQGAGNIGQMATNLMQEK